MVYFSFFVLLWFDVFNCSMRNSQLTQHIILFCFSFFYYCLLLNANTIPPKCVQTSFYRDIKHHYYYDSVVIFIRLPLTLKKKNYAHTSTAIISEQEQLVFHQFRSFILCVCVCSAVSFSDSFLHRIHFHV